MEIDSGGDICGIPGKNKYRRERELKKYFKLLFRVLAAVFLRCPAGEIQSAG